ncbi:hypothetical protein [Streptomyces netropsis]|uniref:Secreted protein n=1 Tax=Streptomyces netropsis TaxID=55404 RepID=A0A7W7LDX7_STRNE|nr:hypothetical protein [Streptomyces netropsis]MBB4887878.1 hypothetical protein [Streptomyces netropsis]GGR52217.1 hypothetical protein GCM10010219_66600 [Streptomyces netropsis]
MKWIRIPVMAAVAALTLTAGMTDAAGWTSSAPASEPRAAAPTDHTGSQGAEVVIPAGQARTAIAPCPAGREPSGGGGVRSGKGLFLTGSSPRGNAWEVKFSNKSAVERRGSAFVVCTAQSHTRVADTPLTVPAHQQSVSSFLRCPGSQVPAGGGWEATGTDVVGLRFSASTQSYHAVVFNNSNAVQSFNAVALCSTVAHEPRLGNQITVQPGDEGVATANCDPGQVASGGGSFPSGQAFIGASRALPNGTGWQITAENTTGTPQKVTAEAICTSS